MVRSIIGVASARIAMGSMRLAAVLLSARRDDKTAHLTNTPIGARANRPHLSFPRLRVVFGAKVRRSEMLRSLGLCLSHDDAPNVRESLRERISAQEIDWITTVDLANQHHVTP